MKWSFASVGVLLLGLIGVAIILLFQELTTNNENDYYLLKEVTEASMLDAIDYKTYRETGSLKIKKEVFVESFTRRFAESTLFVGSTYTIKLFDIMEYPPKVSIIIDTGVSTIRINDSDGNYSVVNSLTSILEYNNSSFSDLLSSSIFNIENNDSNNPYKTGTYTKKYYSIIGLNDGGQISFEEALNVPGVLNVDDVTDDSGLIKNIKIDKVDGPRVVSEDKFYDNMLLALINRNIDWVSEPTNYDAFDTYYNINNYNFNNLSVSNKSSCRCGTDGCSSTKCKGNDNYLLKWHGSLDNSNKKKSILLYYDIKWKYDIFK